MAWRHIRLLHLATGEPLSPSWTPTVRDEEIEPANQSLSDRHLPWRWVVTTPSELP